MAELDLGRPMIPFLLSRKTSGKGTGLIAVLFLEYYAIKYVILLCSMSARLSLRVVEG